MRVIGIDPGLRRTGWGVIKVDGNQLSHVGNGVCKSTPSEELSVRLLELYLQLKEVIILYKPTCAAVGHADKAQVEHMVKMQLPGAIVNGSDAADALGIALCHVFQGNYDERVRAALSKG